MSIGKRESTPTAIAVPISLAIGIGVLLLGLMRLGDGEPATGLESILSSVDPIR